MGSSAPWRSELIISPCVPVHWYLSVGYGPTHQKLRPPWALLPPYTHLWETWKKSSIHSVCPWGQVRVKVLSPNPQLLRLGQLLAKPRGVVPNKNTKAFKLSTRKINLGVYCFLQTIDHLTEININIHSPRYKYNQFNLHQKDTKKQLSGASYHSHQHIIKL
jgi:hypothetical protein